MKKIFSIFLIALLIISSIGPLPVTVTAETVDFPGAVPEAVEVLESTNKGTVTVIMNEASYTLTLHRHRDNHPSEGQVGAPITNYVPGTPTSFTAIDPGLYYVKAEKAATGDQPAVSKKSAAIPVQPKPLTVAETGTVNIISPTQKAYTIRLTDVSGSKVRLYNNNNLSQPVQELNVTASRQVTFDVDIAASNYYQLTQVVNGAESKPSQYVVVQPNDVTIERVKDSGPNNDAGEILVKNVKPGNRLKIYYNGSELTTVLANSLEYTFTGLKAGIYRVEQIENNVPSKNQSNEVTIQNEQIPLITLVGGENLGLEYSIDINHNVTRSLFEEPGYSVNFKNGKTYAAKTSAIFCEENTAVVQEDGDTCTRVLQVDISGAPQEATITGTNIKYTPPGIYTVTYHARDLDDRNLSYETKRTVTVKPNTLNLTNTNTDPALSTSVAGDVTVHGVYPGATVSLYRDRDNAEPELLKTQPNINSGDYTFDEMGVGNNYFAVQEVNGVRSNESTRVNVLDKTPPILQLNGEKEMTLEVGDTYIEPGAFATDNIDSSADLESRITTVGTVNTSLPGVYTMTYHVTDRAGNVATPLTRKIYVKPRPVTAIGGTAVNGEIGVSDIFPGNATRPTILYLHKYDTSEDQFKRLVTEDKKLENNELTTVLRKYGPGRYYVTQVVNGQESYQSNIVEIVDIDKPYILLNGLETVDLVLDENKEPYFNATNKTFTDPGATANDYLEADCSVGDCLSLSATLYDTDGNAFDPIERARGQFINYRPVILELPGIYKITYRATAPRGSEADPKHRIIRLAPPKVGSIVAGEPGSGNIKVNGVFAHPIVPTTLTLHNSYGQVIESKTVTNVQNTNFTKIPAGIGYYVTQTVNGMTSARSNSINLSLYNPEPKENAFISSFKFPALNVTGIINNEDETIYVTVPSNTDVTRLAPVIQASGSVSPSSGTTQNFSTPVVYTVIAGEGETSVAKNYTVTVVRATNDLLWEHSVQKNIPLLLGNTSITLTPNEKREAEKNGVSFQSSNVSVYVPAPNVQESRMSTLALERLTANTMYTAQDPMWKTSIEHPISIAWGDRSSAYVQPIEVAFTSTTNKAFAKIERNANNELVATIQPSYNEGNTKVIGLVTEPGQYALINAVSKPYIQNVGLNQYQLFSITQSADIYYTTNSQLISYEKRDAASSVAGDYVVQSDHFSLDKWTKYTPGQTITVPGEDLYVIAVKDQVISPVNAIEPVTFTPWNNSIEPPVVSTSKPWNISFSAPVSKKALYNESIKVTDDSTGATVPTTLVLSTDGRTITVFPKNNYSRNKQYTLWIGKQVKSHSANDLSLHQARSLTFIAK